MRTRTTKAALFVVLFLTAGCSTTHEPTDSGADPVVSDGGIPMLSDGGTAAADASVFTRVDAGSANPADASPPPDAGIPSGSDAGGLVDAGAPDSSPPIRIDAGSPLADSGSPRTDAGAPNPPVPDAGVLADAGCPADPFEVNDTVSTAVPVASGTGWPFTRYEMTWSSTDPADWVSADLDSTGIVGVFRVHASDIDSDSMVEVRVMCPSGVVVCRGSNATKVGSTCIARRTFNAYADVSCNVATPSPVTVLVGVERGERPCGHQLSVHLMAP